MLRAVASTRRPNVTDCHHTGGVSYGAFSIGRHISRRDFLSGTALAIAAGMRLSPSFALIPLHRSPPSSQRQGPCHVAHAFFAAIKKALARSAHDAGIVLPQSSALTRRRLLRLSAAAAGAAALSPVSTGVPTPRKRAPRRSIAIIGGGVAGLTAAYRLHAAGAKPVVFEASNRWGGRMFTQYDFYKGMFCELGGEFVDTNHEDLQKLANELGVEMQKLAAEGDGEDLYFFKGAFHTPKDMIDPEKQTGAFAPIAKQIAEDAEKLTDKDENWTEYAAQARPDEPQGLSGAVPRQDRRLGDRSARCGLQHRIRAADGGPVQPQYGGLHRHRSEQAVSDVRRERRSLPHQGRLVGADQGPGGRAREQDRDEAGHAADGARLQGRADRHELRCAGRRRLGKLSMP